MKKLVIIIVSIIFVLIGIAVFGLYVRDQNIKKAEIRRRNKINQTATELGKDYYVCNLTDCDNIKSVVISIFCILPFIICMLVFENSHISSNFFFNDSSITISCLIIFTIETILSLIG